MAAGSKEVVSSSMGDKSVSYEPSLKTLESLRKMEADAAVEVGLAAGTYAPRTYARQGGRGQ
jgi:hypothetical protein